MRWFKRRRRVRSKRLIERKRRLFLFKSIAIIFALIVFVGLSSWVLYRPFMQIDEIIVNGNNVISDSEIIDIIKENTTGKYLFLFPRSNIFIYPENKIKALILTSFRQIKSVDIVRSGFQTLYIEIKEQRPYALWCIFDSSKNEQVQDNCYFLNKGGLVFSKAPNFTGNVFFRFYGGLGSTNPIGKYYLKVNSEFNRVDILINSIKGLGIVPIELHPLEDSDMELYMEDGSKVLFTKEQSSSEVFNNLKIILESETFKNKNMENVEYIDLRFGDKVYFKLK